MSSAIGVRTYLADEASRTRLEVRSWSRARAGVVLTSLVLVAGGLRFWNLGATFESSDQASMGYLVAHSFGIQWIFAHQYGPVLPLISRTFAALWTGMGLPFTEGAARMPMALLGTCQVLVTYLLVRELGGGRAARLLACGAVALLPSFVSDGHYAWGDHVPWLLAGSISLWGLLSWTRQGGNWRLFIAGTALFVHCLSSLYALPLPLALLVTWMVVLRQRGRSAGAAFAFSYVLPCLAALSAIIGMYLWTGWGQLGYLLTKGAGGTFGLQWGQLGLLPGVWVSLFGWVLGVVAMLAVILRVVAGGTFQLNTRAEARWALWVWLLAALGPLTLAADWTTTGYPVYYFTEVGFAGSILAALFVERLLHLPMVTYPRQVASRFAAIILVILAEAELLAADLAMVQPGVPRSACSCFRSDWGRVHADSGVKAAGLYVRRYVPESCTVLSLHGAGGMELPVAEFYCGRKVLAGYDFPQEAVASLTAVMADEVDVVIVDAPTMARDKGLAEILSKHGFVRVASLRRDGDIVRFVFARDVLNLIEVDWAVERAAASYDRQFAPTRIPTALPAEPGFLDRLARYQIAADRLKHHANSSMR